MSQRAWLQRDRREANARRGSRTRPHRYVAHCRGHRAACARVSTRDGSPRRQAVSRSRSRHQARSHREKDPQDGSRGEMVTPAAPLRIVFFGTPDFAVPTLHALHDSRHPVVGVVTQPDRARGRGHHSQPGPVKQVADQYQMPVLQPERLRDDGFLDALRGLDADLGVVAAYGRILTDAVLTIPRLGLINVHASLLPRYRGAAPVHRAVMAGERETGVTIMRVVKALDAGPMLSTATRPIAGEETSVDVEWDLAQIGARLLVEAVDRLAAGTAREESQNDLEATYAHRLTKDDSPIDWARPARELHDQIRGLHPWPHAE